MQLLAIAFILIGETVAIFAELRGAKIYAASSGGFWPVFWPSFVVMLLGTALLVAGYMLALKHVGNVWVVTAISLGSILIIEPVLNLLYMGQAPTLGAGIGFTLGVLGILSALFIK